MSHRFNRRRLLGLDLAGEITPQALWAPRRAFAGRLGIAGLSGLAGLTGLTSLTGLGASSAYASAKPLTPPKPLSAKPGPWPNLDKQTRFEDATTYNNFYEFGTQKSDPAKLAPSRLRMDPWTLVVDGLVAKPQTLGLEDLLRLAPLEERVYRLRCVEGWSMVIPWIGYSLSALIRRVEPLGSAKYLAFTSLADPKQMPGLRSDVLEWPFREGLRLDEASHDLTLLCLGAYGQTLLAQNGGPVRLVVPWKYGFKSAKSLARITFVENQPQSSWNMSAPHEYGFYSNVNPGVPHRRWSQATERRIGEDSLFAPRRPTLMFNGYAEAVEGLYAGMDLRRFY